MEAFLIIKRDIAELIVAVMILLKKGVNLFFSNNLRKFKLDDELANRYKVKDISKETIDKDFERNQSIHQCWVIEF